MAFLLIVVSIATAVEQNILSRIVTYAVGGVTMGWRIKPLEGAFIHHAYHSSDSTHSIAHS